MLQALESSGRELTDGPVADAASSARLAAVLGRTGSLDELDVELSATILEGAVTVDRPGLLDVLRANTAARLAIDQPGYSAGRHGRRLGLSLAVRRAPWS